MLSLSLPSLPPDQCGFPNRSTTTTTPKMPTNRHADNPFPPSTCRYLVLLLFLALSLLSLFLSHRRPSPAIRLCDAPIVYNKPHKTGSTTIQKALLRWAASHNRRPVFCSPFLQRASASLRECIPSDPSRCAVVATHVELDPRTRALLHRRLGGAFVALTSTRHPHQRLISSYLQITRVNVTDAQHRMDELSAFFRRRNPWELYNYHTGEARDGSCPMRAVDKRHVMNLVKHYDVVLDVDLPEVSNAILMQAGLFKLPKKRKNVRDSHLLKLDNATQQAIKKVSCVEEEMHRLFRLRMASLFERATKKPCLSNERNPTPCF